MFLECDEENDYRKTIDAPFGLCENPHMAIPSESNGCDDSLNTFQGVRLDQLARVYVCVGKTKF